VVREKILVVRGEIWTLFAIFMFIILFHCILIRLRVTDTRPRVTDTRPHQDIIFGSVKSEYPVLSEKAIKILIPFATTYLCEKTFSSVTAIKNKYRCRLEIQTALRVAVTSLETQESINLFQTSSNKYHTNNIVIIKQVHFILIKCNFYYHYFIDVCSFLKKIHVSGPRDSKL
jgi:hypothetical protein